MPIAKTFHNEVRADGKPVFIVRTFLKERDPKTGEERLTGELNTDFSRKLLGVTFHNGVGRTKYEERARQFSEVYEYEVQLPWGYEPWVEVKHGKAVTGIDADDDNAADYLLEEDDLAEVTDDDE